MPASRLLPPERQSGPEPRVAPYGSVPGANPTGELPVLHGRKAKRLKKLERASGWTGKRAIYPRVEREARKKAVDLLAFRH